jgi:hypothetical protein
MLRIISGILTWAADFESVEELNLDVSTDELMSAEETETRLRGSQRE